ncbi:hypothetical protein CspHIS471_0300100 [Cutaneotrichosporon sp. HIS471]|nr:hypothetical protein CspHIS471_0300100 [Cutaneotrichosporon sp. HIS471]
MLTFSPPAFPINPSDTVVILHGSIFVQFQNAVVLPAGVQAAVLASSFLTSNRKQVYKDVGKAFWPAGSYYPTQMLESWTKHHDVERSLWEAG